MAGNLQPLDQKFPIVEKNGTPTLYFIRWAQQRQIDIASVNQRIQPITTIFDGGGSAVATTAVQYTYIPYACTIYSSVLFSDLGCTASVEIWRTTFSNYPPTSADKISASAPTTITAGLTEHDTNLTGWSLAIPANSFIAIKVASNDVSMKLTHVLNVIKD